MSKMRLIFFGDSITEGYAGVSYVDEIEQQLQSQLNLEPVIVNMGQAGSGIADLTRRVKRAEEPEEKFHWAVLGIGVNDIYFDGSLGVGEAVYLNTYRDLVELILDKWAEKLVVFPPLVAGDSVDDPSNQTITRLAGEIEKLVNKFPQAMYLDMHNLFMNHLKENKILTIDGVHLNQAGGKLLADSLVAEITR